MDFAWIDFLDIPSVKVIGVQKNPDEIIFELEFVNGSTKCPDCGSECVSVRTVKVKQVKDLPMLKRKCFIKFHHRRFYCSHCKKTFMERLSWVDQYERYTSRYAEWVSEVGKEIDVLKASSLLGESYKVVERIVYYRSKDLVLSDNSEFPFCFGIDEFAYKKGKKDYGVVIANKKRAIDVLPSRKESALRTYFSSIKEEVREKVAIVTMDMWNTFINLVEEFFPNAKIISDRFHVMKLMNKVVDKVRKSVQKQLRKEENKELKGLRWVMLRNKEDLDKAQLPLLKKAYTYSPMLHKVHLRKEEFRNIFEKNTDKKKAEKQLDEWVQKASQIKHRSMTTFLKTVNKRKEYILNYFDHYQTNGFMEGIMNKIKTIKRQHYGLPNFYHLRTRILSSFT